MHKNYTNNVFPNYEVNISWHMSRYLLVPWRTQMEEDQEKIMSPDAESSGEDTGTKNSNKEDAKADVRRPCQWPFRSRRQAHCSLLNSISRKLTYYHDLLSFLLLILGLFSLCVFI